MPWCKRCHLRLNAPVQRLEKNIQRYTNRHVVHDVFVVRSSHPFSQIPRSHPRVTQRSSRHIRLFFGKSRGGASYGFAFVNFINTDQSNSEDVSFSMPGRACQDVSVVIYDRTHQSRAGGQYSAIPEQPCDGRHFSCVAHATIFHDRVWMAFPALTVMAIFITILSSVVSPCLFQSRIE